MMIRMFNDIQLEATGQYTFNNPGITRKIIPVLQYFRSKEIKRVVGIKNTQKEIKLIGKCITIFAIHTSRRFYEINNQVLSQ